jgi:3,4-dihydroxy 2-butanone 4-phosphate synthase/GTP cyclohydrolase II
VINRQMNGSISRVMDIKNQVRAGETPDLEELRDYGVGAQILAELGIHDMILLTNTHHSLVALEGYGLNIAGERPITAPEGAN